jgi:molybdopterin-guanine dinucleotide biosynthesis protein A
MKPNSIPTCAGIILCGGLNTRMQGRNKALLELGDQRILDRIVDTVKECCDPCMIITREPKLYAEWQVEIRLDIFDVRSPLTGIHAGLHTMDTDFAFVTSCDTPLLKKEVIQLLMAEIEPDVDVIVPLQRSFYQPMCAIYSYRCTAVIERMLHRRQLKVDMLYERVQIKTVPYERFEAVDPQLNSFFNVNTPAELEIARRLASVTHRSK